MFRLEIDANSLYLTNGEHKFKLFNGWAAVPDEVIQAVLTAMLASTDCDYETETTIYQIEYLLDTGELAQENAAVTAAEYEVFGTCAQELHQQQQPVTDTTSVATGTTVLV